VQEVHLIYSIKKKKKIMMIAQIFLSFHVILRLILRPFSNINREIKYLEKSEKPKIAILNTREM